MEKFNLNERQKIRLQELAERELAITRGMLFNQLQEWKRKVFDENYERRVGGTLNVVGEAWKAMELTKGDMDFINQELEKFVKWQYPSKILTHFAETLHKKLASLPRLTKLQQGLKLDLESALTSDEPPF